MEFPCMLAFFEDNSFDGASSLAVAFENSCFHTNNKLWLGESQLETKPFILYFFLSPFL